MTDIKWSHYIPYYPNVQIAIKRKLGIARVVEPTTEPSVTMNLQESLDEKIERVRQLQESAAVLRYDKAGNKILSITNTSGDLIDISA